MLAYVAMSKAQALKYLDVDKTNDTNMAKMRFYLDISPEQYQRYYQGSARFVQVQAEDGRSLNFPLTALQPYISHAGIQGRFEIEFSDENKLLNLTRI